MIGRGSSINIILPLNRANERSTVISSCLGLGGSSRHRMRQQDRNPDHVVLLGWLVGDQRLGHAGVRVERLYEVERPTLRKRKTSIAGSASMESTAASISGAKTSVVFRTSETVGWKPTRPTYWWNKGLRVSVAKRILAEGASTEPPSEAVHERPALSGKSSCLSG